MKKLPLPLFLLAFIGLLAQDHSHSSNGPITFPDILGYRTLSTDLHQHTVFSDGNVWPTIRVMEALRDGLDVISLTEHLEYQPHAEDIPHPDRNRSFELALKEAKDHDLLIIHGSEITRRAPMGHSNALFISDANPLLHIKDSVKPFQEAKKQGAFVFWNHPNWSAQSPTGDPIFTKFQEDRVANGELHGIEVLNDGLYDKESFALALEKNLVIMGTSDVHGLIDWDYTEEGHHRPITLVFAKEKTAESLKEALFEGRTVAVYNSLFVGKEAFVKPLLEACISASDIEYQPNTEILSVTLKNSSSSDLLLKNAMEYSFYGHSPIVNLPAHGELQLQLKTQQKLDSVTLKLEALEAFVGPDENPVLEWNLKLK